MPLSRWFRGGVPTLRDRVVKGLQQARDGDADGAQQALASAEDAPTWNLLGRILVWLNNDDAVTAFRHAAAMRPQIYGVPHRVSRDRFARLAEQALAGIPETFQTQMSNTMIVVDDLPDL